MIKKNILFLILFGLHLSVVHAQYKRITVVGQSGVTQDVGDNIVTVSYLGYWSNLMRYGNSCDIGTYLIGYTNKFFNLYTPTSFTFSLTQSVQHIRYKVSSTKDLFYGNPFNLTAIEVNGTPYTLSNSNINAYQSATCGLLPMAQLQAGVIQASDEACGVHIYEPGGISSTTITHISYISPLGWTGSYFSFYIGQINISNSGPACEGDSLQLWGDKTITWPGTFSWVGPNGFTSQLQHPVVYPLTSKDAGVYTLTYITGVDTFTDTTHVTLQPGPSIPVITADTPICAGTILHLYAAATPANASYTWTGPNNFTARGATIEIPNVQPVHAGVYKVTATLYECRPTAHKQVSPILKPGSHSFSEVACSNFGYDFNGRKLYEAGIYTDTFPGSNGCDSVNILNLVIIPGAEVNIGYQHEGRLCQGDSINVFAVGNGVRYEWYDSEGELWGSEPKLIFPLLKDSNQVQLVGTSNNNCSDTAIAFIPSEACCTPWLPNAFSPNGDGQNDCFRGMSDGHPVFNMSIFNRWGERVFYESNSQKGWDGTYRGKPADVGTYFYYVTGQCLDGSEMQKKGEFLLLR